MTLLGMMLLMTLQACSSDNSIHQEPQKKTIIPTLTSLQRLNNNGVDGVWMSDRDAGLLATWIYELTGESGN